MEEVASVPRRFTEEEVQNLLRESARIGAQEALTSRKKQDNDKDDGDDKDSDIINPKVVKQLKDTVAVFTALKDLSSNPLQKTIEETVGVQAQNVVQSAFARPQYQNRDLVDTVLNSQFAYGLGTGLGNRGPELVETMAKTFGNEKTAGFIGDVIKGYGGDKATSASTTTSNPPKIQAPAPTQAPTHASPPASNETPTPAPAPSVGSSKASDADRELLLDLNINNPDHVAAYAETQGGIPIEAAKRMLTIHQQGFLKQMQNEGKDVSKYVYKLVHPIEKNNKNLKMKPIMNMTNGVKQ